MAKKLLQNISVPHSMSLIYNIKEIQKTERGCVKMMHPLFRYRTMGFSFFIEYDLFSPVSMLFGGIICHRWLMPP